MQRSISINNNDKTALNADAPGCLESGAFVFAVSFTEKSPDFSRPINIIYFHDIAMRIEKKNSSVPPKKPKKNLPPGKYAYLFLALVAIAHVVAAVLSGCNPVSFYLKGLGIEYQFEKGACQIPPNQQQK